MTIAIIDYGMGNLRSVQKAVERSGGNAVITAVPEEIAQAEKIILPGVGAMRPAMERLYELQLVPVIQDSVEAGKPFLGICLGLQLLFEQSHEGGIVRGLGLINGTVDRFSSLKVPHMGWNRINLTNADCPLWQGLAENTHLYFCHSYYVKPSNPAVTAATTDYGVTFTAAVQRDNLFGVQFHPEKSQSAGLKILENFVNLDRTADIA